MSRDMRRQCGGAIVLMFLLAVVPLLPVLLSCACIPTPTPTVVPTSSPTPPYPDLVFDDSTPDRLSLSNAHYKLTLSKTNGAIIALVDNDTNVNLTLGSRNGCLWGAIFPNSEPDYVGGCSYARDGRNHFTYSWDPSSATLTLGYQWRRDSSRRVDAVVRLRTSPNPFFELQMELENHWGGTLCTVLFPSDLLFADGVVQAAYGPFLMPGVRLTPGFFSDDRSYVVTYPSDAAFADYLALDVSGTHLAIYTVNPSPQPLCPAALGFIDDDVYTQDAFMLYHSFHTWVEDGKTWHSPIVQVCLGQSPQETITAYRKENGIGDYPSLTEKLGSRLEPLSRAPLIKADAWFVNKPFQEWIPELDLLPSPSLLHLVAFQRGGHDENYPDFLPPDPRWGSTDDLRKLVEAAQERGILVMPYTNPTWWDDESPTLTHLPSSSSIADVAVLDREGQPVYETYGEHGGYVVSPYAPLVQQRLASLMGQWWDEVPVDLVFEDQIGARPWRRDFNPAAPNPLSYSDSWLEHTKLYSQWGLMTEMGWDRLAQTVVGFHGSLLTWCRDFNYGDKNWGEGNWQPYPLALWLFHDKVLLYQHDLSARTMSEDKGVLTWNLAFGTMLSYEWQGADNEPPGSPWLDLVTVLQRTVGARYAGSPLTAYEELNSNVTCTTFGDLSVIANWHPTLTYEVDRHRVAPGGFLARTEDGSLLAGVFTDSFNGRALAAGEHYLVIERTADAVTVRQPLGTDTALSIDVPSSWHSGKGLQVMVYDREGQYMGKADFSLEEGQVRFTYEQCRDGLSVEHYLICRKTAPLATTWYFTYGYDTGPPYEPAPGLGKCGWNDITHNTLNSGLVVTRPEIGFYSSADVSTIRWQLEQMQNAGISVVALSWWGWGDADLDGEVEGNIGQSYNEAIKTALDYIKDNDLDFQFMILVEEFWKSFAGIKTEDLTNEQKRMITDYIWNNFYSPKEYGSLAYQFQDKPLLVSAVPRLWSGFENERYTLREIWWTEEDERWAWAAPTYAQPPSKLPGPEGVAMIWPRKDEWLLYLAGWPLPGEPRAVDPLLKEGAYDHAWKEIIQYKPGSEIELIWLWSWNSYNDLLYIEPDDGRGAYAHGDLLTRKTGYYYQLFTSGESFKPMSADQVIAAQDNQR